MRRARALGRATVPCLLAVTAALTAACNGSSSAEQAGTGSPSATSSSAPATGSPSGRGSSAEPALDPEHTVDPPGRRTGQWGPPDIVAMGSKTLDADLVHRIEHLPGVAGVEQISSAQVLVQNRAITVAAVDPASYRNFVTDVHSAETKAVWDRVAGGELAIRPALTTRLPIDDDGYLALGSTKDAPQLHIGAYAQQSWLVDAVVNETWIPTLHMTEGNTLLIRTGDTAPAALRKPIERVLAGSDASVQMTDVVAREGLDPDVVQTAVVVGTVGDAVGTFRYTVLGGGHIAPDPAWVSSHIVTRSVPILGSVTCNKLIFPQLEAALRDVQLAGLADKIDPDQYAGCYYPRFIAGTTTLSNHAFGLALDLNTAGNQRGTVGEMDRGVVAIFKKWGFAWGGDWHYTDPMHFEVNQLKAPR